MHQLVVPLVKGSDPPITIGKTREREGPVGVALRKCEVFTVRISKAHVALGPIEGVARPAAVEPFIRRPAQALARDPALDRVGAIPCAREVRVLSSANACFAAINDLWVGKTDGVMESRRPVLLEEPGLFDPGKDVGPLLAVQSIGLKPFFAPGDP